MDSFSSCLIFLFSLFSQNLITQAPVAVAIENAALAVRAGTYRGASPSGHRYGVQINETLAIVLTIAKLLAFFSFVCPHVLLTQPRMMLLTAYVPMENMTMAKYLAPVLRVAQPRTKPKTATALAAVMCQVRSLYLPDCQDQ